MLQYVGENHGLREPANRKDYTVRQKEFWDHFLKGAPAPEWWLNGVPHLEMDDHIKDRIHLVRPPEKKKGGRAVNRQEPVPAHRDRPSPLLPSSETSLPFPP